MCSEWYTCNGAFLPVYILLALAQVDLIRPTLHRCFTPSTVAHVSRGPDESPLGDSRKAVAKKPSQDGFFFKKWETQLAGQRPISLPLLAAGPKGG